jgi:NAD(P)-dependent dehydrogenase (short-subunit alcohol dehydrogenase family)
MRLQNQTAIITGAGAGIGRAIAQLFAFEGAKVLVADTEEPSGRQTVAEIQQKGGEAIFCRADISAEEDIKDMARSAVEAFGTIDILVNNAAAFVFGRVEEVTTSDWEKVFKTNVVGYANCVREVLPTMRKAGKGAIVNMASVSSFIAQPAFIPYNASKGAILQLTRCLAMDLASDKIRVNAVCPGAIVTEATRKHIKSLGLEPEQAYIDFGREALMQRMGQPMEVAYGVLFLASEEASFITGTYLVIDGGATID